MIGRANDFEPSISIHGQHWNQRPEVFTRRSRHQLAHTFWQQRRGRAEPVQIGLHDVPARQAIGRFGRKRPGVEGGIRDSASRSIASCSSCSTNQPLKVSGEAPSEVAAVPAKCAAPLSGYRRGCQTLRPRSRRKEFGENGTGMAAASFIHSRAPSVPRRARNALDRLCSGRSDCVSTIRHKTGRMSIPAYQKVGACISWSCATSS